MVKTKRLIISEGMTLDHIGLGLLIVGFGILLSVYQVHIFDVPLIVIGLFVAASVKGTVLDKELEVIKRAFCFLKKQKLD